MELNGLSPLSSKTNAFSDFIKKYIEFFHLFFKINKLSLTSIFYSLNTAVVCVVYSETNINYFIFFILDATNLRWKLYFIKVTFFEIDNYYKAGVNLYNGFKSWTKMSRHTPLTSSCTLIGLWKWCNLLWQRVQDVVNKLQESKDDYYS